MAPTKKKLKSLTQFVKEEGSQEAAARKIRVSYKQVNLWINGHAKPVGLTRDRLIALGVDPKRVRRGA